jgi:hypothetical protein
MAMVRTVEVPFATLEYHGALAYCEGGHECSLEGLPTEVGCGIEICPEFPTGCGHLESGQTLLVLVNRLDGCLISTAPELGDGVWCGQSKCYPIGITSALSHALVSYDVCRQFYFDIGAWPDECLDLGNSDNADICEDVSGCISVGISDNVTFVSCLGLFLIAVIRKSRKQRFP